VVGSRETHNGRLLVWTYQNDDDDDVDGDDDDSV